MQTAPRGQTGIDSAARNGPAQSEVSRMPLSPGSPAPDFHLPSTAGTATLSGLKGRPFLLSFFSMAFTPR
jgi:hypothetical protein